MLSAQPQAPMPKLILAVAMLLAVPLVGCAPTVIRTNAGPCSALIPPSWSKGVPPATLPAGGTVGDWEIGFLEQTGQLDKANDRTTDTIYIVKACEGFQQQATKKGSRGFFGRLFG